MTLQNTRTEIQFVFESAYTNKNELQSQPVTLQLFQFYTTDFTKLA